MRFKNDSNVAMPDVDPSSDELDLSGFIDEDEYLKKNTSGKVQSNDGELDLSGFIDEGEYLKRAKPRSPQADLPEVGPLGKAAGLAKEYLGPTIEAVGPIAGGVVGTALGPYGTVAGTVLGGAISKGVVDVLGEASGERKPPGTLGEGFGRAVENVESSAGEQAFGGALGAAAGAIGKVGKGVVSFFKRMSPKNAAREVVKSAAGPNYDRLRQALSSGGDGITSKFLLEKGVSTPELQAIFREASKKNPQYFTEVEASTLSRIYPGRSKSVKDIEDAAKIQKNALNRWASETIDNIFPGGARVKIKSILSDVTDLKKAEDYAGERTSRGILNGFNRELKRYADTNDEISPQALYNIRKNFIKSEVERVLGSSKPGQKSKLIAKITSEVTPIVDKSISDNVGPKYSEYLKEYSEKISDIDLNTSYNKLLTLSKEDPKGFMKLMSGNNPKKLKSVVGLDDVNNLKDNQVEKLQAINRELNLQRMSEQQAKLGKPSASSIVKKETSIIDPRFGAPARVVNALTLNKRGKVATELLEAAKSPNNLKRLLEIRPESSKTSGKVYSNKLKTYSGKAKDELGGIVKNRSRIAPALGPVLSNSYNLDGEDQ